MLVLVTGLSLCYSLSSRISAMKGGMGVADFFQKYKQSVMNFLISPLTFGIQYLFLKIGSVFRYQNEKLSRGYAKACIFKVGTYVKQDSDPSRFADVAYTMVW